MLDNALPEAIIATIAVLETIKPSDVVWGDIDISINNCRLFGYACVISGLLANTFGKIQPMNKQERIAKFQISTRISERPSVKR